MGCVRIYDEDDVTWELEYDYTPYNPGRTYGPAEFCYPPEGGEIEPDYVRRDGVVCCWDEVPDDIMHQLKDAAWEAEDAKALGADKEDDAYAHWRDREMEIEQ